MSARDDGPAAAQVQLRYYQEEAIAAVRYEYSRGAAAALVVLATGCGKTMTALSMAAATVRRGGRVLWVAHRTELVQQPLESWRGLAQFHGAGEAGIVQGGSDAVDADVVFASTGTIARGATSEDGRLAAIFDASDKPVRMVVVDECHHYSDDGLGQFSGLIPSIATHAARRGWAAPRLLGLTATPVRADGRGLTGLWGARPSYAYGYDQAIAEGYLVPPRIISDRLELDERTAAIVANAREGGGEVDKDTAKALQDAGLIQHAARSMGQHVRGRRVIAFTCDLAQARLLYEALGADGWAPAVVDGGTPKAQRAAIIRGFKRGDYNVLVNCNVLTEGTDIPACDAIVHARPMGSWSLYVQATGRGLRTYPGKTDCIVLDLLGAADQHSLTTPAILLDGLDREPEPFDGMARRDLSRRVARGARVHVVPRPGLDDLAAGDDYRWQIVGIYVGKGDACQIQDCDPINVRRPQDVAGEGDEGGRLMDLTGPRGRVEAHWLRVPAASPVFVADVGDAGRVWLAEVADGWMAYLLPKRARKPVPLGDMPLDAGLARGLGDDLFRQASSLVRRGARWRAGEPSEGQRVACGNLGLTPDGPTRGDYSDAISLHKGAAYVKRHGVRAFQDAIAEHMQAVAKKRAKMAAASARRS